MYKGIYNQKISYLTIIELYHNLRNKSRVFLEKNKKIEKKSIAKTLFKSLFF